MKRRLLVYLVFVILGCDSRPKSEVAPSCDTEAMRPWILDCIEKANPHADEEPEDYVLQCEGTAARLFCGPGCFLSMTGVYVCHAGTSPKGGST